MTRKRATFAKIVASLLSLAATGIVLLTIPALAKRKPGYNRRHPRQGPTLSFYRMIVSFS
jgi:hypothetical protein